MRGNKKKFRPRNMANTHKKKQDERAGNRENLRVRVTCLNYSLTRLKARLRGARLAGTHDLWTRSTATASGAPFKRRMKVGSHIEATSSALCKSCRAKKTKQNNNNIGDDSSSSSSSNKEINGRCVLFGLLIRFHGAEKRRPTAGTDPRPSKKGKPSNEQLELD